MNVVTGINTFTGVNNTLRPDLIGDPSIIGSPTQWFNNSGVRSADRHGRGIVHVELGVRAAGVGRRRLPLRQPRRATRSIGPGFSNTDFSVIKNLTLTGSGAAAVPARSRSICSTRPTSGSPGASPTVGSTSFGVITNTRFPTGDSGSARQIQFAIKALF